MHPITLINVQLFVQLSTVAGSRKVYTFILIIYILKQDQGSIAPSTVHPISFISVQLFVQLSTVTGTKNQDVTCVRMNDQVWKNSKRCLNV